MILSWVRNLQGKGFKSPYFIYTGNQALNELDIVYHESRGIKIIDYREFVEGKEEIEWLLRYKIVLEKIINFEENNFENKNLESIDYLYKLLSPLNKLNILRREDVQINLRKDYTVGDDGLISQYSRELNHLKNFNNIYENLSKDIRLEESIVEKYEVIKDVFEKAHIYGYRTDNNIIYYQFDYTFKNKNSFNLDYKFMESYSKNNYTNLEEKYIKAYFLFKIGNFKESYDVYTEIAEKCFVEKNYLTYYFSQINRYLVYTAIESLDAYSKSIRGILTGYGGLEKDLTEDTYMVMKKFDIDEIFNSLPLDFKNKYPSLKDLYNQKYLYKNIYSIMDAVEKSNNSIKNKSVEFGFTSIGRVMGIFKQHLNFVYGNYLIVDEFVVFKKFIRESIKALFMKSADEANEYLVENKLQEIRKSNNNIQFDSVDFSCMIQYFDTKELKDILSQSKIKQIEFTNVTECFKIGKNLLEYYKIKYDNFDNIYFKKKLEKYLNNLVEVFKYTKLTKEQYTYVVNEIFNIDNNTLNIGNKIMFLDKQELHNPDISNEISCVLEDIFIKYLNKKIQCIIDGREFDESSCNGLYHIDIINYIFANEKYFKSNKIEEKVVEIIDTKINFQIEELIKMTLILPQNTIDKIVTLSEEELKKGFDFKILNMLVRYDLLKNIQQYEENLVKYVECEYEKLKKVKEAEEDFFRILSKLGYWSFIGIVDSEKFMKFKGIKNKFDFFIDMDSFDFNKFKQSWLVEFNIDAHKNISQNQKAKAYIRDLIQEHLKKPNLDISEKEWLLKLYLDVYNK